ncbi:MAG TPA: phosphotransferase, partial [Candidatus Binataceae bacterium]|nr:phosphotransferase [Candidatus Binataceae bacterium]
MTLNLSDTQRRLGAYFGTEVVGLRVLASGWETTVFEFCTATSGSREKVPGGSPLVLRYYEGSRATEKGTRESTIMQRLADINFPLPRPYLFEPDPEPIGAPFLIMDRISGRPLFSVCAFPRAFKTFSLGFIGFVREQVRLHRLGINGRVAAGEGRSSVNPAAASDALPLLERIFRLIEERIEAGPLPGLRDGLNCLLSRAARYSPASTGLVHMDYHPQNVMVSGLRVTGILDWVNADYGDRYLCAATTAVILSTTAMERPRWMSENIAGKSLRALFASLYLPLYNAAAPMELERFRHAQGVAA